MQTLSKTLCVGLLFIALNGCISQTTTQVSAESAGAAVGVSGAGTRNPQTASAKNNIIHKIVLAGKTTRLWANVSVNPDCTPKELPTFKVTRAPEHGTIAIENGEDYSTFPANSIYAVCNKTKHPAIIIKYTPQDGFAGNDAAIIDEFYPNGNAVRRPMLITVK